MPGILGRKLGMTRIFEEDGKVIPVTLIQCEPNTVVRLKNKEKDGYEAVVLGFEPLKKPAKTKKFRATRESRLDKAAWPKITEIKTEEPVTVKAFEGTKEVTVTSTSKGKGFQGTVKRWHFSMGPRSHGSHFHREPGSIGPRARMGKLHKGKKLAGHMGNETVTLKRVPLVSIDIEKNLLAVKGAVPGPNGGLVIVKS